MNGCNFFETDFDRNNTSMGLSRTGSWNEDRVADRLIVDEFAPVKFYSPMAVLCWTNQCFG